MKIAIIGGGIVGSTAAYYLAKEKDMTVVLFDDGNGQATKAAAGIISPWFSKRRNKAWYKMARLGADFYQKLLKDLENDGFENDFYQQSGVFLFKKKEEKLEELFELAKTRKQEAPLIGEIALKSYESLKDNYPNLSGFERTLFASGAARVDGDKLVKRLQSISQLTLIRKKVGLKKTDNHQYLIDGMVFDKVILASGAWLPSILEPLGYQVDVRPQKGQLKDYYFSKNVFNHYPVLMPEGEADIIPFSDDKVSVGASHENEMGYDLSEDKSILDAIEKEALPYFTALEQADAIHTRVGTRAYTSDYSPFFGQVPMLPNVYAASGLGSSGLTTGPLIAYQLVQLVLDNPLALKATDYPIANYIQKQKADDTMHKK
ncbi:NAD(P)/FAD-dependent oxidoreductase [Streptococcus pacificus]|uniref:FAD-binding oxidoreductase n=1 Tax=Streptococcus pacificus TaxID=2740577 RepID=A0ABS0ZHJ2_9STRE|nr:FAD-dependent oxidoreductase [Streptococcus pacificus]MBJ8325464.1 FAD-binding oxidoreductase [Streptococcus pacificus]